VDGGLCGRIQEPYGPTFFGGNQRREFDDFPLAKT